MQYVRSISGSVSKTWNSINPATLSGAIDVIVVEQADGTLACSPFHVRFGKFSLLRPSDKKVEFTVNGVKQDYAMKLGEGGEAFFVFQTSASVPEALQTSPLVSPVSSPESKPTEASAPGALPDPEPLDLATDSRAGTRRRAGTTSSPTLERHAMSDLGTSSGNDRSLRPNSGDWSGHVDLRNIGRAQTEKILHTEESLTDSDIQSPQVSRTGHGKSRLVRTPSPPPVSKSEAVTRAINLSKKLWTSNIPTQVTDNGDIMLDMTGYKSNDADLMRAESIARQLLSEEIQGDYDIGALIGADEKGNLWIYSSEEAKEAAGRQAALKTLHMEGLTSDAASDPGYHSDDTRSESSAEGTVTHIRRDSDSAVELLSPPQSPDAGSSDATRNYAKTLRLTSDQLRALDLKPGSNSMSFSVNRATCQAYMFYWKHDTPVVISDIDGTITKSDALGHVLNMIGRDWTHMGVAKLYTDIVNNGYNILYLTSRSVGQADTTRAYLNGVVQDGYHLPKGPVIMSPDRTIAALRREIYLRKPEVFKMACLRDIMNLYNKPPGQTPFYAGFGNRLTDALSYRSVNIPSTRIFTINSFSEVSLDLLSLNKYKTGYTSMREIVDHFFPPVGLLVQNGGEEFTDFNYWRDKPLEVEDFSASESESGSEEEEEEEDDEGSLRSEDEIDEELAEDLEASYFSRESVDEPGELGDSVMESVEGDGEGTDLENSAYYEDQELEGDYEEEEEDDDDADDGHTEEVDVPEHGHDHEPTPTYDQEVGMPKTEERLKSIQADRDLPGSRHVKPNDAHQAKFLDGVTDALRQSENAERASEAKA